MTGETRPPAGDVGESEHGSEHSDPAPSPHDLGIELPDDPDRSVAILLGLVSEARDEATSYLDDLKRVAADFDNFRKRTMREQSQVLDRAAERVIQKLLPALDSLDAALSIDIDSGAGKQLLAGMESTRDQLLTALGEEGLKVVPTVGEKFDPAVHEPVGAPAGEGVLVVGQELRRGYLLNDKLVRAALVTLELEES